MTMLGSAIVIDVRVTPLPPAQLHALEIWSDPQAVAKRFATAKGFALPSLGQSAGEKGLALIRFEPTVWLVEGDVSGLSNILGDDGALTAIGGGIVRVALEGSGWRRLLMEGGVFDAENPAFSAGCSAATVIDHVNIRLHVTAEERCIAYVPASYAHDMIDFWTLAAAASD
jgi:heterotetrameric sarcosine oxidase gamma subunit